MKVSIWWALSESINFWAQSVGSIIWWALCEGIIWWALSYKFAKCNFEAQSIHETPSPISAEDASDAFAAHRKPAEDSDIQLHIAHRVLHIVRRCRLSKAAYWEEVHIIIIYCRTKQDL